MSYYGTSAHGKAQAWTRSLAPESPSDHKEIRNETAKAFHETAYGHPRSHRIYEPASLWQKTAGISSGTRPARPIKKPIVWKLAQTWGTGFPIFGDAVINMADMVKEMSNGELEIRIDSANKHKAALGILDMVKAGQYEMGHSASYYWKGKDANTMFFNHALRHDRTGTIRMVLLRWRYGIDEKGLR